MPPPPQDPASIPPPPSAGGGIVVSATVFYAVLVLASLGWLGWRERLDLVPRAAAGAIGVEASLALGFGVGLAISGALTALVRYSARAAGLEQRLRAMLGPVNEPQIIVLALGSSIGEEFFFRLAMQDAVGPWLTAVAFAALHIGPSGTRWWTVSALLLGGLFGWMVHAGLGLASVTVAHALINYLSLRRMQTP